MYSDYLLYNFCSGCNTFINEVTQESGISNPNLLPLTYLYKSNENKPGKEQIEKNNLQVHYPHHNNLCT